MTEKTKRDYLAAQYGLNRFPIQFIETRKDFTQDINFSRRMVVTEAYQAGFDAGYQVAMDEANDKIYYATRKVPELEYEIAGLKEQHRMQLAGISVCLLQNTKESIKERITKDNPCWTPTYEDACATVDREIELRERIQKLREALEFYGNGNYFENGVISSKDIEPAEKITGSVIYHYTDPPEKYHIFIGGKTARAALKEDGNGL